MPLDCDKPETPEEMLARLGMMVDGDGGWDLSVNDEAAIKWALAEIKKPTPTTAEAFPSCAPGPMPDFATCEDVASDIHEGPECAPIIQRDVAWYLEWLRLHGYVVVTREVLSRANGAPDGGVRPVLQAFAERMEAMLRDNDYKGGWEDDLPSAILKRLREETDEIEAAISSGAGNLLNECADVANFAMMLFDLFSNGKHRARVNTPTPSSLPEERAVVDAAMWWWESKRPVSWSVDEHVMTSKVNAGETTASAVLAVACGAFAALGLARGEREGGQP